MDIATAISGVLTERSALQQPEALSAPSYISEHMQRLSQYNSALEECLGDVQKEVEVREATLFKKYTKEDKMSVNAAEKQIKYELAADKAEITRITRLVNSSWRFISVSQSRIKHLIQEAQNQI